MKINYFKKKSVKELKEMFPNSEFFPDEFDSAIMGVTEKSNRIVYHETVMIYTLANSIDNGFDKMDQDSGEWCDLYDDCLGCINSEYDYYLRNRKNRVIPKVCRTHALLRYKPVRPKSDSISSDETLLDAS